MDKIKIERTFEGDASQGYATISFKRDENKEFKISFGGNLDLYFILNNFDKDPTFYIGIDNYALYEIFDKLYKDIIFLNLLDDFDDSYSIFDEEEDLEQENRKMEFRMWAQKIAEQTELIQNDRIIWLSDDFPHDAAPYFMIEKLDNAYRITFLIKTTDRKLYGEEKDALYDYKDGFTSVRIRNDGSTYQMFNVPFMRTYNALLKMEIEEPQIHIEEYLLDRKLANGESLEKILTLKKADNKSTK